MTNDTVPLTTDLAFLATLPISKADTFPYGSGINKDIGDRVDGLTPVKVSSTMNPVFEMQRVLEEFERYV